MKRCPQCEFIYEDDQSLCDMDGQSLVHDHALSVIQPRPSAQTKISKPSSRNGIALPAGAGLLLAIAVFIGYSASPNSLESKGEGATAKTPTQQVDVSTQQSHAPIQSTGSASALEPEAPKPSESVTSTTTERNATIDKAAHARSDKVDERFPIARNVPPLPRLRPLPRLPEAKPLEKKSNPTVLGRAPEGAVQPKAKSESAVTGKKDSKLGSFLKKTGRVLSKPFRL